MAPAANGHQPGERVRRPRRPRRARGRRGHRHHRGLAPELVTILRPHHKAQSKQRLAAADWHDHGLVFCQPDGRPIDPRDDFAEWKALLAEAGVRDGRLHDGRHTSATLLLEQGVDVRVVMEILGHSDLRVTQRYIHVASPLAQEAARRMGKALWG